MLRALDSGARVLRTSDLDYELPPGAVATAPAEPRDAARLMVVSRRDAGVHRHCTVRDLPAFLQRGDLLVVNTTRVLPARFEGVRADTGGRVQGLYLGDGASMGVTDPGRRWVVLLQGKRPREGALVTLMGGGDTPSGVSLRLVHRFAAEAGGWLVEPVDAAGQPVTAPDLEVLELVGRTPLPPYILKARRDKGESVEESFDRARYQTVYAAEAGSVAAPTAGLHLTDRVLRDLDEAGVRRAGVTLHVGTGTFKSVETEFVEQHPMHAEWCTMSKEAAAEIRRTRASGARVICVGTTAARTVESYAAAVAEGGDHPGSLTTRLLITPGYQWRWVDGLMTNFHLPRSTLIAMCGSLVGGVDRLKGYYREALGEGYRFFSYGDAMLILP